MPLNEREMLRATPDQLKSADQSEWNSLIRFLLSEIAAWLKYEVESEPLENASVGNGGFCVDIHFGGPTKDAPIYWKGILGASIIEDRLRIVLFMFPFAGDEQLVTKDGKELAEFDYVVDEAGSGVWTLLGWFADEYGEFEGRW